MSVYEGIMQGLTESLEYAHGKRELRTEWGIAPLHYKGYSARPEYSAEDRIFYGKILGISDLVDFQSESAQALEDEFHKAVDDYLKFCAEISKTPPYLCEILNVAALGQTTRCVDNFKYWGYTESGWNTIVAVSCGIPRPGQHGNRR